jgi:hypothetical protein
MAYIGNKLADSYTSFAKQDFTTSATTSYTLDYSVTNENEIALFINFVRQEPTTAYTASGTTLTLTSATSATDDMYCVFLGKALQTVNPPAGSVGLSQLSATGTASASTYLRGDNSWSAISVGDNTPAFFAYRAGASITIPDNTSTLLIMDTEVFDTNSAFDTSTGFFTPQESGKYYVFAQFRLNTATNLDNVECMFKVNGSNTTPTLFSSIYNSNLNTTQVSGIVTLNGSTDYVAPYGVQYSGGSIGASTNGIYFYGYKLNGV